jgi:O-antigen ligase
VDIFKKNTNLIVILFLWLISGVYAGPVVYPVIVISLFYFKSKNQYMEMLLGFFYLLILSDSRLDSLGFAETAKDIYMVIVAMFLLFDGKKFSPFNTLYLAFLPFFIMAVICLFYAPDEIIGTSIEKTLSYFLLLLVVPNLVIWCSREKGYEFYRTLIYFGMSILVIGFILRYLNPNQALMEGRYRGMLGNPNGLGIFVLLFFISSSLMMDIFPQLLTKREKNILYIAVFASLILSNSRSSLFGIAIFLFFSYFYRLSPYLGFIMFLVFAASYQYIISNLVGIISSIGLQEYMRTDTIAEASGRFVAWRYAWSYIQQSIFIGRGFEFTNYLFLSHANYLEQLGHQGNAHNSYITLWLDTGLIGLFTYVVGFFSQFIKAARRTRLALPVAYAVVFSSFFESWLTASLNPFTIQIFMILTILTSDSITFQKTAVAVPVQ